MRKAVVRDVRAAVADACRRIDDPIALERAVAAHVERVVPFDRWCALTLDPATANLTGGFHDEGLPTAVMPRLLELENESDYLTLRSLPTQRTPAATIREATDGDPARSARYRDVLEPAGMPHELRAAFRADSGVWGAAVFFRASDVCDFTPAEVDLLSSLSPVVAEGLRRATVLAGHPVRTTDEPGLVLCTMGERITIDHVSPAAQRWLDEIDDAVIGGLPFALFTLVHSAHRGIAGERRARIRTRAGRWLSVYAERLGPTTVSLIVEPTRTDEIAELLADAYRLSAREREVAALAVRGLTNAQIGTRLYLSPHTVGDHLKRIFEKTRVTGRTELAARLYFDHTGTTA
jgi:DNA-binding CsgD family transcriptional regulator